MTNETTASQPKSIGDDEQFQAMTAFMLRNEYYALVKLIDNFRAPAAQASATIQAAPPVHPTKEMISSGMRWLSNFQHMRKGDKENALSEAYFAMLAAAPAATIQEPVMVAEPGLRNSAGARKHAERIDNMHKGVVSVFAAIKAEHEAAPMVADPAGVAFPPLPPCDVHAGDEAFGDNVSGYSGYAMQEYARTTLALAATVKAVSKIRITLPQARRLVDFFGGHDADVTVTERPADWEQAEEGLYAFCTEYPEDGAQFLGATEVDDELMRLGTVKAVPSEALDTARIDLIAHMIGENGFVYLHNNMPRGLGLCTDPELLREDLDNLMRRTPNFAAPLAGKTGGGG